MNISFLRSYRHMCGIFGAVAPSGVNIIATLIKGITHLEYRGYDSAGIAAFVDKEIKIIKSVGKVRDLERKMAEQLLNDSHCGIIHTRWATHGVPSEKNAHPIGDGNTCIIHNGIIDNFGEIKEKMCNIGYHFVTDTDTEIILALFWYSRRNGMDTLEAINYIKQVCNGSYAFLVMNGNEEGKIYGCVNGAPLVIGVGDNIHYFSSDLFAVLQFTNHIIHLETGEIAVLEEGKFDIYDNKMQKITRAPAFYSMEEAASKNGYEYFMLKEIMEQPKVLKQCMDYHLLNKEIFANKLEGIFWQMIDRMKIIACGSSFIAAQVAKYWIERYCNIVVDVEIASEFRYRQPLCRDTDLFCFVSQSGETADTLAALRCVKNKGNLTNPIIAIVNNINSIIAKESDIILPMMAGQEIGVASTKAFSCQLMIFALMTIKIAQDKKILPMTEADQLLSQLMEIPLILSKIIDRRQEIENLAKHVMQYDRILYISRGITYPICLEAALKMKELSYIASEGIAAGELKHGSLALIDNRTLIIVLAPFGVAENKIFANIQEIKARDAHVVMFYDRLENISDIKNFFLMPKVTEFIAPFCYTIPVQFLSYYVALMLERDVDQPRHLAKSVTVE